MGNLTNGDIIRSFRHNCENLVVYHLNIRHLCAKSASLRLKMMKLNQFVEAPDTHCAIEASGHKARAGTADELHRGHLPTVPFEGMHQSRFLSGSLAHGSFHFTIQTLFSICSFHIRNGLVEFLRLEVPLEN